MGGTDDQFILKAILILKGCPAPSCNGGHELVDLPHNCLTWWKEIGWNMMGWKGARETASSATIKKKINSFRKNFHLRKKSSNSQPENQLQQHTQENEIREEATEANTDSQRGEHSLDPSCFNCLYRGFLPSHLQESHHCLTAHLKKHLGHRADKYRGRERLAIFDLGLVLNFCLSSRCTFDMMRGNTRSLAHVQSACLKVFQHEGEQLLQWEQGLDASTIQLKLRHRKEAVRRHYTEKPQALKYHEEMTKILNFVCDRCYIQGPLLESQDHRIFVPQNFDPPQCLQCMNDAFEGQEKMQESLVLLGELGGPGEHEDSLKMVIIDGGDVHSERVVLVPAAFNVACKSESVSDIQVNPASTTVLVPKNPDALDAIGDGASERANMDKKALESVAEIFGKRFFLGPLKETLSLLHRLMLARIRVGQLSILARQKGKGKGVITSRAQLKAAVKKVL